MNIHGCQLHLKVAIYVVKQLKNDSFRQGLYPCQGEQVVHHSGLRGLIPICSLSSNSLMPSLTVQLSVGNWHEDDSNNIFFPILKVTLDKKAIALKGTKAIKHLFSFSKNRIHIQYVIYFFVVQQDGTCSLLFSQSLLGP